MLRMLCSDSVTKVAGGFCSKVLVCLGILQLVTDLVGADR
jgi:hypothetical protein